MAAGADEPRRDAGLSPVWMSFAEAVKRAGSFEGVEP